MTIGTGLAIVGVWLGVGIIGNRDGGCGAFASICAMMATIIIALAGAK